jgi:methyltransferase family protein
VTRCITFGTPGSTPLFWRPERLGAASAWWGHVPFAHWIVSVTQPRLLVELGTEAGVSYSAFCETVVRERLNTRSFAVDTWKGDPHTGLYGEDVYRDFRQFHDDRYAAFSTLLRFTFDAALEHLADRSIDLLHIDGLHTYEAVQHDFETWRPKLSDRAVVLFHDTNMRERGFGVWRLWLELRDRFPSFEFLHGHGLGLLAIGDHPPPAVAGLCALANPAEVTAARERFARLGQLWALDFRERALSQESAARDARIAALEAQGATMQDEAQQQAVAEVRLRVEATRARDEAIRQAEAEARLRDSTRITCIWSWTR